MDFTDEAIKEFADIWEEEFGERISDEKARLEAGLFMELYWALLEPLPDDLPVDERELSDEVRYNAFAS